MNTSDFAWIINFLNLSQLAPRDQSTSSPSKSFLSTAGSSSGRTADELSPSRMLS